MNEYENQPEASLGVMAWLFETYRDTFTQLSNHISYFVGALMVPAAALGVTTWYAFKDSTVDWTVGETMAETGISIGGEWSVPWALSICGLAFLAWFLYSIWSGFTAVIARESDTQPTLPELLLELKPLLGPYVFGAFIQILVLTITVIAPVVLFQSLDSELAKGLVSLWQIIGLFVYGFWFFKSALWVAIAADKDGSIKQLKKQSFIESKFVYLLPRILMISLFFFFVNLAITGAGNFLIAAFGLTTETVNPDLSQDWSLPMTEFIGNTIWVTIIKAQFLALSFGIIGALWTNGMIIARRELKVRQQQKTQTSNMF